MKKQNSAVAHVYARVALIIREEDESGARVYLDVDESNAPERSAEMNHLLKLVVDASREVADGKGFFDAEHVLWKVSGERDTLRNQIIAIGDTLSDRSHRQLVTELNEGEFGRETPDPESTDRIRPFRAAV